MEHTSAIYWPNGNGETPCSAEYAATKDARDAIYVCGNDEGETLDDLSPEDYQRWNELDDKLNGLQLNGHLGKSIRY